LPLGQPRGGRGWRAATDEEWAEFQDHFQLRKLELGTCGRPYGTPCVHENACVRCPMLKVDPRQRHRLADIIVNLATGSPRPAPAAGSAKSRGLQVSLDAARAKLASLAKANKPTVARPTSASPPSAGPDDAVGITALRGSRHGGEDGRHLLAAFDHAHGVVLGQLEVGAKTNEIPLFTALLDRIEITGAVISADALHAQREHARYLARRRAHYVITVKRNQPGLYAQLAALPWRDVPVAYTKRERGHGRTERRTLKVTSVAKGLAFPHAGQAIKVLRRRNVNGKVVTRDLLRGHVADRHPGQPRPAGRHHPRPLGHRRPPPLGP
jgi:hypothetical protein